MSKKYPDLVEQLPKVSVRCRRFACIPLTPASLKCIRESTKSFVLDAEAVAFDRSTNKLMPFQELSKRKRKDVKVEDIQVRVCLFAFDLLYLNGEASSSTWGPTVTVIESPLQPLLQKTLNERRELLRDHFTVVPGEFDFAKSSDGETVDEIQSFLEESVKDGCEGLMVKMLESDASYYEPSRRSVNWLKVLPSVYIFQILFTQLWFTCSSRKIIWLAWATHWTLSSLAAIMGKGNEPTSTARFFSLVTTTIQRSIKPFARSVQDSQKKCCNHTTTSSTLLNGRPCEVTLSRVGRNLTYGLNLRSFGKC